MEQKGQDISFKIETIAIPSWIVQVVGSFVWSEHLSWYYDHWNSWNSSEWVFSPTYVMDRDSET